MVRFPEVRYVYSGCFRNGKRHGSGREQCNNQWYRGEFKEGKRDGRGWFCFCSTPSLPHKDLNLNVRNAAYSGEWKNDMMHGKGVLSGKVVVDNKCFEYTYTGQWIENKRNDKEGRIILQSSHNKVVIAGEWENNHIGANSLPRGYNGHVFTIRSGIVAYFPSVETAMSTVRPLLRSPIHSGA